MPLILPGNVASATAEVYEVANSCRFNAADSAYMQWTPTDSAGTDGQIYTLSFWLKRGLLGSRAVFSYATPQSQIMFESTNFWNAHAFKAGGTTWYETKTNELFRDPSAWYHFVTAVDTTQGTEANRVKVYVNGVQITSFADVDYPTQDLNTLFFTDIVHTIGRYEYGDSSYFDGYLAEFIGIDGTQYAASDFGEFDSNSPTIWKPKDPSGLTFGDEGFWLDFEDSSALGNDVSGNNNDWTAYNLAAADQATDTPTNNFCTLNPVATSGGLGESLTFSEGNCKIANTGAAAWEPAIGTMAARAGKWYCEMKATASFAETYGIMDPDQYNEAMPTTDVINSCSRTYGMYYNDGNATNNDSATSWGEVYGTGDIISIAVDLDNMKLYMAKNGVWVDSGDPTSGATGTGTHVYFGGASNSTNAAGVDYYAFVCAIHNNSISEVNFGGSPAFAITSGNADGNGYGNFEYAVPSGYYAMCTKNLAEYG
jgi:hypothetical protein